MSVHQAALFAGAGQSKVAAGDLNNASIGYVVSESQRILPGGADTVNGRTFRMALENCRQFQIECGF